MPGTSTEKLDFTGSKLIQEYIDGDICLLDNNRKGPPRTTQIHFKCNPILFDNIESVVELGTCSYVITVATPRVCHLASKLSHKSLIRCYPTAESSGKAFKKDFHSPPSDSEQTSELSEMERLAHKKWQHNMIVQVASASKLPIFTKLFNELATDIMDETIVGVIKSKSSSEHSTENSSDNNEKEEEPAEKKNEKNSNSESSSPSAPESEQSGSGDETKEPLDNTNLIRSL